MKWFIDDMETLVKSIAEFFGAVLGMLGFVGKPRRRMGSETTSAFSPS